MNLERAGYAVVKTVVIGLDSVAPDAMLRLAPDDRRITPRLGCCCAIDIVTGLELWRWLGLRMPRDVSI